MRTVNTKQNLLRTMQEKPPAGGIVSQEGTVVQCPGMVPCAVCRVGESLPVCTVSPLFRLLPSPAACLPPLVHTMCAPLQHRHCTGNRLAVNYAPTSSFFLFPALAKKKASHRMGILIPQPIIIGAPVCLFACFGSSSHR